MSLPRTKPPKYAIIELISKEALKEKGTDCGVNDVITGLFSGVITQNAHKFIVVTAEDTSVTAYNLDMYSIMFMEISDANFMFEQENVKTEGIRYIFPNNALADQAEALRECERVIKALEHFPFDNLCPGLINATTFNDMPVWWCKREEFLPKHENKAVSQYSYNQNNYWSGYGGCAGTVYKPAPKKITVFKRTGKVPTSEALLEMRKLVNLTLTENKESSIVKPNKEDRATKEMLRNLAEMNGYGSA